MNLWLRQRVLHFAVVLCCAVVCLGLSGRSPAQTVTANAAQQLVFSGLRSMAAKGTFNAVGTDAAGDVYLAFDQGDGVRVLKVANDGGALLAQVHLGQAGDAAAAISLDGVGNVYIAGTSTSGALPATSGAAISTATAGTTSSFVAKFDGNLNELFLTFTGGTRISASALAVSADSVFVTGTTYSQDLPVSDSAIEQAPAFGSLQNGFVEAFSADGSTLTFATYVTGAQGDTTPTGIAVDAGDDVWLVGSTTAPGFPTLAAIVPEMLSNPSGFLMQLTPAGDGIVYSTFVPGAGLSAISLDSSGLNLLVSGQVALGQFPVDTVTSPLVPTAYQVLLRMTLDGSAVLSGTVTAPGLQSVLTSSGDATWVAGSFTPGTAPLLPQPALSTIGNAYAVRVTPGIGVDQTVRYGGLADANQTYASIPVGINGVAVDQAGAVFSAGFAQPTASQNLLPTETYDFPLRFGPTPALPSVVADAEVSTASCGGSLCAGSAGYLTKIDPIGAGTALTFSTDGLPMVILRNLGSAAVEGLQLTTSAGSMTTSCGTELLPGGECDILLSGGGAGTLTASSSTDSGASIAFASYPAAGGSGGLAFAPKELDFGIQTASSSAVQRTVTITNLGGSSANFSEGLAASPESLTPFHEVASDCPLLNGSAEKLLPPGASCTLTIGFSASAAAGDIDGFVTGEWTIGSRQLLLTGYSQAANLSVSATVVDFGTQIQGGLALPRYLFLSNASNLAQGHVAVSVPSGSPFAVRDDCPDSLAPGSVCRLAITYTSGVAPSADSVTLALDEGLSVLVRGETLPAQTLGGSTSVSDLVVSPTSVTFGDSVVVTGVSAVAQTVVVTNNGNATAPLKAAINGDFAEVTSCTSSLEPGESCALAILFTPSQAGTRQGILTLSSGPAVAPVTVMLSGTGTSILAPNNGTLNFPGTPVGQPIVQAYKVSRSFDRLMLQTTGPYQFTLVEDAGFGFGEPPSSAYVSKGSGSCHNCWVGIRFQPASAGPSSGTVSFSSSSQGLPYVLQLTGSGTATSDLILSPSVNDFGTIPVNSSGGITLMTLTNLVEPPSSISIANFEASGDFAIDPAGAEESLCGTNLAYGASCSVPVVFMPEATGLRDGSLSVTTSAGSVIASLLGTGTEDPGISLAPTSLTFANLLGSSAQPESLQIKNTGASIATIGLPATEAAGFTIASGCGALAPRENCSVQVSYTAAAQPTSGVLTIPVTRLNSGGMPETQAFKVQLVATVTAQNQGLNIFPSNLSFGPQAAATMSAPRRVSITNVTGTAVTISLTMPHSYVLEDSSCSTLQANASCEVAIAFTPLENGDVPGTISVSAVPTGGSGAQVALIYADGFGVGTGALTLSGGLIVDGVFDFGLVAQGQSSSQRFHVENSGTQAITVRRIVSQAPYTSTTTCGAVLLDEGSCSVEVTYTPNANGSSGSSSSMTDTGVLLVESDAQTSPNVLGLEGKHTPASTGAGASTLASFLLSQGTLNFPGTTVGDVSASQTILLTNNGKMALQVGAVRATTADFSVQNGCASVLPGDSCTIVVASTPQSAGSRLSTLEIASNAPDSLEYVTLVGTGQSSPLTFSPLSLAFGNVLVGRSAALKLQVQNGGSSPISFSSISASAGFSASGTCLSGTATLAPNATCTEQVVFEPATAGAIIGTLGFITSASTNPLQVQLSGTGLQQELIPTPSALQFGNVTLGSSADMSVKLSNQGSSPITGITLSVDGGYSVTSPCAVLVLPVGASCEVEVRFVPTSVGVEAGSLTVASSDPGSPMVIPLSGTGTSMSGFTLRVGGGITATATVSSGDFAEFQLVATPTGGFTGNVALTCTPMQNVSYASCSLLPSQMSLAVGAQTSSVTINTEESSAGADFRRASPKLSFGRSSLAVLLPWLLVCIRRRKTRKGWQWESLTLLFLLLTLPLSGCGGKGGGGLTDNYTPPGQYQFLVQANSTSGSAAAQTVTLTLVVTARQ